MNFCKHRYLSNDPKGNNAGVLKFLLEVFFCTACHGHTQNTMPKPT